MPTLNSAAITFALQKTFTESYSVGSTPIAYARLCRNAMQVNPSIAIPAADVLDNGVFAITSSLFTSPSQGKIQLINPITMGIKAGMPNVVPTYIRLMTSSIVGVVDVPLLGSVGADNAVISSMSVSSGQNVDITNLRLSIFGGNDLVISDAYANNILRLLFGFPANEGYSNALMGTWPKVVNSSMTETNAVLAIEAYDGVVPLTADETPAGTLLWKRTIPTSESAILSVSGNSIYSNRTHQASALASGTPTFIRIVKNAITAGTFMYPRLCIQLTTAKHVAFNQPAMVVGAVNTLQQFNLAMLS